MKVKEEREKAGLKLNIQKTRILPSNPITSRQIDGKTMERVTDFIFLDSKITANGDCSHEIKRRLLLRRKAMTNLDRVLKKQRYHFADKGTYSQCFGFSSSHVQIWELDHKKGWELKNWCLRIVVLKTLDSPLDSKDIKPVNTKGNLPWIFIRTVAKAPILWPPMQSGLIGKDAGTGKDWKQKEKGAAENEVVR